MTPRSTSAKSPIPSGQNRARLPVFLILITTFFLAHAGGQDPSEPPLSPEFTAEVAALRENYGGALAKLDAEAVAQYEALQARYAKTENLDGAIWAANQIAQIKGEPPIPGGDADAMPASNPVEEKRAAAKERLSQIYRSEIKKLYQREVTRLEQETRRLTVAGQLDAAQEMSNRAKSLRERLEKDAVPIPGDNRRIPAEIAEKAFTFERNTYYLFPDPMTHAEAVAACEEIGGTLLSIGSEEEYNYFHSMSVETGKPLWIDLQDEEQDLDWRHGSGEKAQFLKWQSGEPNGADVQKHVMIGYRGSWDMRDVNDDDQFYAICEW